MAFASGGLFAADLPSQSFTYQGKFFNSAGSAPLLSVVDLTLEIYSPSSDGTAANDCLLYAEKQTSIDLSLTGGLFSVQVGSSLGAPKRLAIANGDPKNDPGLSMATIFSNKAVALRAPLDPECAPGYVPSSGDARKLRVTVWDGGVPTVLTPDQVINAVPQATNAETLQGVDLSNLIQATGNITSSNLGALVNGADAGSSLHHHDSLYLKSSGNSYTTGNLGIGTTSPSVPLEVVGPTGSAFKLVDGNQGAGKVLVSDADGKATWQSTSALAGATGASGAQGMSGATGASGADGASGATGASGAAGAVGNSGATGASGAQGNSGATGASGAQGMSGATGASGTDGAVGNTGASGATGAAGSQGNSGATGATGADGAAGFTGASGATGAQGAIGNSGATGASGTQGMSGATGASGTDGAVGNTGASGAQGNSGATGASGAQGNSGATGASGAQGNSGATGASGAQGMSGATGASGTDGAVGNTGASGATGAAGSQGNSGATGATGADGAAGFTGASGATGAQGAIGNSGATGASGTQGMSGATGASGTDGAVGNTGASGAQGNSGATGASGAQGISGATGASGTDGAVGNTGASGATGAAGAQGNSGATGATGSNGADGFTGASGATGAQGAIGNSGATGASGADGAVGNTGASGIQGSSGATGASGAGGAVGNSGATGASGSDGAVGNTGASGATGAAGAQGNSGVTGATGADGANGFTGVSGATGANGAQGNSGATGATGASPFSLSGSDAYYSTGNVGIGTVSPSEKLHVNGGSLRVSGTLSGTIGQGAYIDTNTTSGGARLLSFGTGATVGEFKFYQADSSNSTNRVPLVIDTAGKVGVGTQSPAQQLEVSASGFTYAKVTSTGSTAAGVQLKSTLEDWMVQSDSGIGNHGLAFYDAGRTQYRMLIDASGNVGIGTVSPDTRLHVAGSLKIVDGTQGDGKILTSNASGVASWATPSSFAGATGATGAIGNSGSTGASGAQGMTGATGASPFTLSGADVYYTAGNVGIGTISPTSPLEVVQVAGAMVNAVKISGDSTAGWAALNVQQNGNGGRGLLVNMANSSANDYIADFRTANVSKMFVGSNGNVGLGTTGPTGSLHVVGPTGAAFVLTDGTQGSGKVLTSDANGKASWQTPASGTWSLNGSSTYYSAGNVGIGTSSPQAALHVNGDAIYSNDTSDAQIRLNPIGGFTNRRSFYSWYDPTGTNGIAGIGQDTFSSPWSTNIFAIGYGGNTSPNIRFVTGTSASNAPRMTITNAGNVGIGTTSPSAPLQVAGDAYFSNSGTNDATIRVGGTAGYTRRNFYTWYDPAVNSGGYVGIGQDPYYANWSMNLFAIGDGTNTAPRIDFITGTTVSNSPKVSIVNDGKVGIGTTAPATTLHVVGATGAAFRLADGNQGVGKILTSDASGNATWSSASAVAGATGASGASGVTGATGASPFSLNGSSAYYVAGNVGIGTTGPAVPLEVVGASKFSGGDTQLQKITVSANSSFLTSNGNLEIYTENNASEEISLGVYYQPDVYIRRNSLIVAAGTTQGANASISAWGPSSGWANYLGQNLLINGGPSTGTGAGGYVSFGTSPAGGSAGSTPNAAVERMRITPAGNVGIGTTAPATTLHVVGATGAAFRLADGNQGAGKVLTSDASGNATWSTSAAATPAGSNTHIQFNNSGSLGANANFTWNNATERMGVGASSPGAKLHVLNADLSSTTLFVDDYLSPRTTGDVMWIDADTSDSTAYNLFRVSNQNTASTKFTIKGDGTMNVVGMTSSMPASSGTVQTGQTARIENSGQNVVLDIGGNGGNGMWMQSANKLNLASSFPLMLNPNGGNVGIGTSAPAAKLEVAGGIKLANDTSTCDASKAGTIRYSGGLLQYCHNSSWQSVIIDYHQTVANLNGFISGNASGAPYSVTSASSTYPVNGNMGQFYNSNSADNSYAGFHLRTVNSNINSQRAYFGLASSSGAGSYRPNIVIGQQTGSNNYSEVLRIDSSGNMGIGTTSPGAALDVKAPSSVIPLNLTATNTGQATIATFYANGGAYNWGQIFADVTNNWSGFVAGTGKKIIFGSNNSYATPHLLVDTSGNVGIGTSSPGYKLDVAGDVNVTGSFRVNGAPISGSGSWNASGSDVYYNSGASSDAHWGSVPLSLRLDGTDGSTTFTDSSSFARTMSTYAGSPSLTASPAKYGTASLSLNGSSCVQEASPSLGPAMSDDDFTIEAWVYHNNLTGVQRYVSAGTTAGGAWGLWTFGYSPTGTSLNFAVYNGSGYNDYYSSSVATPLTTGAWHHVAVVRTGSILTFYVDGTAYGTATFALTLSNGGKGFIVGCRNSGGSTIEYLNGYIDEVRVSKVPRYTANFTAPAAAFPTSVGGGNVGIGTSAPSALLHVNGTALATAWNTTSDRRLKENVSRLEDSLEKILSLEGVNYTWKDRSTDPDRQIGLIAQEVQAVFPEAVKERNDGFLSVNYGSLVAPLIEAVKSLHEKVMSHMDRTDERLEALQKENAELKQRLDRIERGLAQEKPGK